MLHIIVPKLHAAQSEQESITVLLAAADNKAITFSSIFYMFKIKIFIYAKYILSQQFLGSGFFVRWQNESLSRVGSARTLGFSKQFAKNTFYGSVVCYFKRQSLGHAVPKIFS